MHYLTQMEKGTCREAVVESIKNSAECKRLFENSARVSSCLSDGKKKGSG